MGGIDLENASSKKWGWRTQVRNPIVYVEGKITHPEHATVNLGNIWHRVLLDAERQTKSARNVAFID